MSDKKFKLALCQIRTDFDVDTTMSKTEAMLREAAEHGAQAVCLPEMYCCQYRGAAFRMFAGRGSDDIVEKMSRWAKEYGLLLVGGSIPEVENGRMYNTCYVFDRSGAQLAKYRKMHLFDSDLPELRSHESEIFGHGNSIEVFDTEFGRMGVAVCFDVRFPELIRTLSQRGAELVFLPAQFNDITGSKHWEMLLRARAMDNQIYMAGCCGALDESIHWHSWGHSLVADPFSDIICEAGSGEEIVYADIDLNRVDESRRAIPVGKLLRRDMYKVSD